MDKFDVISDNEIRIVGSDPVRQEPPKKKKPRTMLYVALSLLLLAVLAALILLVSSDKHPESQTNSVATPDTATVKRTGYVEISDTVINNISLHRFLPVNAQPRLTVGLLSQIPPQYVLGAMAADFGMYDGEYKVVGSFVEHGKMFSHSKSKYGFCAILKDTVVIGHSLSTPYFEQAIEERGDFFRQYALVDNGKPLKNPPTHKDALRRSLCLLDDGRLCIIDTDMEVSLDNFSSALCAYGVRNAISLMGSGAAVRWAVDKAGRRYIAGADEYEFPEVVNYIIWE